MIYRPCNSCLPSLKAKCTRLQDLKMALRGLGVSSIFIKCKDLLEALSPGTRVRATFTVYEVADPPYYMDGPDLREEKLTISGTIMSRLPGGKFRIWLDESLSESDPKRAIVRLPPKRLALLHEPRRRVCVECGRPEGQENRPEFHCPTCSGIPWDELPSKLGDPLPSPPF